MRLKDIMCNFLFLNQEEYLIVFMWNLLESLIWKLSILNAPITDEEITRIVIKLLKHKSPNPNGFPIEFYQIIWSIIGNDAIKAYQYFFSLSHILKEMNCTFIS